VALPVTMGGEMMEAAKGRAAAAVADPWRAGDVVSF
jgi:hypothetical protein